MKNGQSIEYSDSDEIDPSEKATRPERTRPDKETTEVTEEVVEDL
jgi:hypothetical protein